MSEKRYGRQTPTKSLILPYTNTEGQKAIELYNATGNTAQPWQIEQSNNILAIDDEGIYIHAKYGYQVSRRNGKGEILAIRELYGIVEKGEHILHTAHRTSTSSAASKRLSRLLIKLGYEEILRPNPKETYEKAFVYAKQYGLERITFLETGGTCEFRTRTSSGGLGEGFDLLVIDEAQEYTTDMQNTLMYTVSDSMNPQIIMTGTPPTAISKGTVFTSLRNSVFNGETETVGWAEWSVEFQSDPHDVDLWYECNPAMGYQLNERKVREEITEDVEDFNIQRLGWWATYNQKSFFSEMQWDALEYSEKPIPEGKLFVGIKYGKDDKSVALSICVKTNDKPLVESIDCQNISNGNAWIVGFLKNIDYAECVCDGENGYDSLCRDMKDAGIKKPPTKLTVGRIISANAMFKQAIEMGELIHGDQPSLRESVSNCKKRNIGSNGGYGFESIKEGVDIALLDSVMLAYYLCKTAKPKKKQTIRC